MLMTHLISGEKFRSPLRKWRRKSFRTSKTWKLALLIQFQTGWLFGQSKSYPCQSSWIVESMFLLRICEGHVSFEDDSVTLHCDFYKKHTRKLILQCICVKGKQVIDKWSLEIEIKNANHNDVRELHRATNKSLSCTVVDQEKEKTSLKQRIAELEDALIPCPLFYKPIYIVQPFQVSPCQA